VAAVVTATDDYVERLARLDTCAVSDARDQLGLADAVVTGLGNLTGTTRIAGRVITVHLGPPRAGLAARHLCTAAIEAAGTGDVIVVAHAGRTDCAGWGGNLSRAALVRGARGTIVHGGVRDIDEARDIGYPVYASAATPRTARGRVQEHAWGVPVDIAGVPVYAGDYVIADGTGIVFVAAADAARVLAAAEAIAAQEASMAGAIATGRAISDVMGASYERMLEGTGR
jgi:4-hydroxy-4-methyl-2-oxoglutarate aldolase